MPAGGNGRLPASGAPLKKSQRSSFENLVPYREIMIATRDFKSFALRKHRCQTMRIAGDIVLGPHRDEGWSINAANLRRRQTLTRSPDAGGQRRPVAVVLVREGAEHALRGVGEIVDGGRLHR